MHGPARRPRWIQLNQPWWALAILAALVVAGGLLSSWNIGYAGYSTFYSTAARSMSMSWSAFFAGAFDPGSSITLDKLPGFLVPQALAARVFGFHPWSVALPQVLEGMVTVIAGYLIGLRWLGIRAGLYAAAALATTPLLASMSGHVMEDGLLTMSLALAFVCFQSAIRSDRLLPLLLCCCWVAVGFQAKMMEAWLILPGLAVGYLLGSSAPVRRRLWRGGLAGLVTLALSVLPMTVLQLVPAAHRPFIDGSTDNDTYSMVFGYNGINRIVSGFFPGAIPPVDLSSTTNPALHGHWRLFTPGYLTQVGWLYPLALTGAIFCLWPALHRPRRPSRHAPAPRVARSPVGRSNATALALGCWLVATTVVLTVADIPHGAYLAGISVQVSALAAAGLIGAMRLVTADRLRARLVLPVVVAGQTVWTAFVLDSSRVAPYFVLPVVLTLGVAAVIALTLVSLGVPGPRWNLSVGTAVLAMFLAPAVWSGFALDRTQNGTAIEAYTGPRAGSAAETALQRDGFRIHLPFETPHDPTLPSYQLRLLHYLRVNQAGSGPLMATDSWTLASPYILKAGADVLPMRGWSGLAPTPTLSQVQALVSDEQLRFVLLTANRTNALGEALKIRTWVRQTCTPVSLAQFAGGGHGFDGLSLYSCRTS